MRACGLCTSKIFDLQITPVNLSRPSDYKDILNQSSKNEEFDRLNHTKHVGMI